ncbi:hypothetical protein MRX96_049396, partial [Rhipicephalus microplus]
MDLLNSRKRLREESGDEDDHAPRKQTATTSPDEESHASQGSEEMSGSEFRTVMHSEGVSSTGDMTTSAPTGGPDPTSLDGAGTRQHPTTASTVDLPPATTESPGNPPSDASAAIEQKEGEEEANQEVTPGYCIGGHSCQPSPTFQQGPPQQWTPQGSTAVRRGFPQTQRASRWSPPKALDAVPGTLLLLRPSRSTLPSLAQFCSGRQPPGGTFSGSPRLTLAQALSTRPGVAAIRVNHKRNIVAADATTRECLEQLLNIKELKGIPVTAREPADHKTSTGFLHGVDGEPAVDSLLPGIKSAVPGALCCQGGANRDAPLRWPCAAGARVSLPGPFPSAASQTPPSAVPAMRSVRPCKGELQLARQLHQMRPDPPWRELQADPVCQLRGAPHSADTPECPRWQEQRKIATIMASSPTVLSRRTVAAAVREEIREARSFASVVKGHPAPPPPPRPDPSRRLGNLAASHSRDCSPPALLPLWPCQWPLLFLKPLLLQLPLPRPSPQLLPPGGRPAVPMAPAVLPAATVELPPADPAYQIVATLLNTLR